jgi:hypothetical protein
MKARICVEVERRVYEQSYFSFCWGNFGRVFFLSFLLFLPFFLLAVVVSGVDGNSHIVKVKLVLGYLERVKLVLTMSGQALCFANSAMEAGLSVDQRGRGD